MEHVIPPSDAPHAPAGSAPGCPPPHPPGTPVAVVVAEMLDRSLDYRAPACGVAEGALVEVPLGPRRVLGCVWGPASGEILLA